LRETLEKRLGSRYVSADLSSPDVMVRLDIVRSPFCDGSFDAIICNHVLEHVPDDRAAMRELLRLLKPGGWALLQVPIGLSLAETFEDPTITTPEAREAAFGQRDHVRIYANDYEQRLESAGFRVDVQSFAAELARVEAARYGLDTREKLYVCRKAPA
jgi:SAM-dependent methyltransferase